MDKKEQAPIQSQEKRKEEHLKLALKEEVQFQNVTTGLEAYSFIHQALPEINLTDVVLHMKS
jgi:isopentenyl-diphosphate Delta-isomerase